jgi:hypothetical protein
VALFIEKNKEETNLCADDIYSHAFSVAPGATSSAPRSQDLPDAWPDGSDEDHDSLVEPP